MNPMIKLYEILVPSPIYGESANPICPFFPSFFKKIIKNDPAGWAEYVSNLVGGLTILKKSTGVWINPATKQKTKEEMMIMRVACTEEQLDKILLFTLGYYKEDAVFS